MGWNTRVPRWMTFPKVQERRVVASRLRVLTLVFSMEGALTLRRSCLHVCGLCKSVRAILNSGVTDPDRLINEFVY
ncbi:hypothetical protein PISMIDRAFT_671875 [Pisolithus microcarpus 441]|uniref:Unplaced genomic scaffold scaffold_4, whole genome shotgun sequence n=1 Tax=Pisolithus microcarpus 441 TaxID=765257 RepID=A0A0C9ZKJ4_9AGAM|nr:hypothetical protein BKA83DRAFT_671875 [Pisolithus microcarpus]KIK29896.1 hypothetical protein PISMIDRAFT_671875 [Pisolithus microcarpus 441]